MTVDEIGVSMKSIPRHENQHTAAMWLWWTVDHVAVINVESGGGDDCLHCVTLNLAIFVFPVTFICIFISTHQHWYFGTSCLYDYCSVCFPLHLL